MLLFHLIDISTTDGGWWWFSDLEYIPPVVHVFVFKLHFFYQFQTASSLNIICKMICFVQKLSFHRSDRLGWLDLARQAAIFEGQETPIYALLHFYAASTAQCSSMLFCFTCLLLRYYVATVW